MTLRAHSLSPRIGTMFFFIIIRKDKSRTEGNTYHNLLRNRSATLQDTHDQEINMLLLYQQRNTGDLIVCGQRNKQRNHDRETPSSTGWIYSNDRNSYNSLGPCARRPSKLSSWCSFLLLVSLSCSIFAL